MKEELKNLNQNPLKRLIILERLVFLEITATPLIEKREKSWMDFNLLHIIKSNVS